MGSHLNETTYEVNHTEDDDGDNTNYHDDTDEFHKPSYLLFRHADVGFDNTADHYDNDANARYHYEDACWVHNMYNGRLHVRFIVQSLNQLI